MTTRFASLALLAFVLAGPALADEPLLTVAEKSDYKATATHAQVVAFCQRLAKMSPLIRLGELGTTVEGRKLPLLILADPPVATPEQARRSGKLIVFANGDIHAGEVCGKEALCMLARDLAMAKNRPLLKDLVIVFAPIFNADGNDRMAKDHRPGQHGPEDGMGIRTNAQGFDLNRDFIKLESPEVRALVRFFDQWDPALFIDTHTTDGSFHQYTITYEGPRVPAGDVRVIEEVRDHLLPEVGRRLLKDTGYKTFFYGNFARDRKRWLTVPATARYGTLYYGVRNRLSVLSEAYSYASYRDRVLATRDFVRTIFEYAAQNKNKIRKLIEKADADTIRAGAEPKATDMVAVQQKAAALDGTFDFLGYVEEEKNGRRVPTRQTKVYPLTYMGRNVPKLSVRRPYAYLLPGGFPKVVENLQRHGIAVEELREDINLEVEAYSIAKVQRSPRLYQGHTSVTVEVTADPKNERVPAGTLVVRTGQALGTLACYLLEPQSDDGLTTWNFFDSALAEGKDFPVLRLLKPAPFISGPVRPLSESRKMNKPITFHAAYESGAPLNFSGSPTSIVDWLEDGEHFLQYKGGQLYRVEAKTGHATPFFDSAKLAKALTRFPAIDGRAAQRLAREAVSHLNPDRTGALFEYGNELYFCKLDGSHAVQLTKTAPAASAPSTTRAEGFFARRFRPAGDKEYATFSPNGKFVAYVSHHNLYVVDLATQTVRQLTADGKDLVSNGKPDWVYGEEIYSYQQTFWWSPDSRNIAFVQFNDQSVPPFTVVNQVPPHETVEVTPYPRAGDPNPTARLGIVPVAGGSVRWVDTSNYTPTASLIVRAGWTPDGKAYYYVQDRAQTWLDICTCSSDGGTPTRLLRQTTRAWVDDPGEAHFLKDGSFLLLGEQTGWKHLYHYSKAGKMLGGVTHGPWEVHSVPLVDEPNGWVFLTGTRDNSIADNLYRVKLDGSGLERLTKQPGDHRVRISPKGNLFVDTSSDHDTPATVRLCAADGKLVRMLDTNPVYSREEYRFGKDELVHIPMPDGFVLEGDLVYPPGFSPNRKYPVWFMTYGGPHAPMVHDSWGGGRVYDQVLAHEGIIVFHCDPRSASGKGAVSTWTAYRHLGEQELKDIESAVRWLASRPYVDASRVGMSGHSYGGFMTSFALTHSKVFSAGIAGAPVTDWHNYDSIYTERYMNTPQENPDGYKKTSVVGAAPKLHGKLLIVHGLIDDNVHLQNTAQLVQALEQADRDFDVMIYPNSRHRIFGPHYQRYLFDFIVKTMTGQQPTHSREAGTGRRGRGPGRRGRRMR